MQEVHTLTQYMQQSKELQPMRSHTLFGCDVETWRFSQPWVARSRGCFFPHAGLRKTPSPKFQRTQYLLIQEYTMNENIQHPYVIYQGVLGSLGPHPPIPTSRRRPSAWPPRKAALRVAMGRSLAGPGARLAHAGRPVYHCC